jgi:anaerobic selenocysteine-containing dehydrogenase
MVHVKDGKMVKIEGDDNHPWAQGRSCPRVLALTQYMYHEERITQPLKRIGKRGQGNFQPISWDEAFDICETRLRDIRENHGAESVLFCQGTGRDIGGPLSFLAYSYGSPNWAQLGLSGHSCFTPRLGAMKATIGDNAVVDCAQFSVERYDDPEWQTPEVILVWGQNPPATCPDAFYGHWIVDCMQLGSKIVSIDPRHTWLSSRSEHHLQIRPGTDGALALGMLNVIISEEIYDHEFVENWVSGFEELKERVAAYPVDKVAQITHLPADEIEATARLFAKAKRAAIQWGVSIDMCADATAVAHAIIALWTITGNIDIPGGQVIARPSHGVITYPYNSEDLIELYGLEMVKRLSEKRIGADRYKMFKNFRGFAHPDMAIEQVVTGDPYPIKGAWIQTANIIGGQSFNSRYHYDALKKLDFIAVVDLFHNPTSMALADIVLPAATFPEKNSIRSWWAPLQIIKQRVQIGECKSDWEINFELAKRFNRDGLKKYQKLEDLFDERLAAGGTTFAEMDQKGGWEMPPEGPEKPYRRHERGLLRVDGKPGFNTGSGKVELYSLTFESWGLDPLPFYTEPPQSHISTPELFEEYPLILITGARSSLFFHSEHRQIPWLREKEPDPYVEIHPDTAAAYGIYDGEWIYIQNDQGKVKRKAALTLEVKPEHIHTLHGWWMPEEEGPEPHLYGVWDYQVNQLVPGPQASKSGFGGGQYRTTLVTLAKIPQPEHTEH